MSDPQIINLQVTTGGSGTFITVTDAPTELQINGQYKKETSSPEARLNYNDWFTKVDDPDFAFGYKYDVSGGGYINCEACFFGAHNGNQYREPVRFAIASFYARDIRNKDAQYPVDFLDPRSLTLKPGNKKVSLMYLRLEAPVAFDTSFGATGYTILQASGALTVGADATFQGDKLTTTGRLGIGTQSPQQPLDVVGNIHASGTVTAINVGVTADERMIQKGAAANGRADLASLAAIEIFNFQYRDEKQFGSGARTKIVAQHVEAVLPTAVSRIKGVVPDIMGSAKFSGGWIQRQTDLTNSERVQILAGEEIYVVEVLETRAGAFRVELPVPSGATVFIYGRLVDDVRVVDHAAIAALHISATQELARQLSAAQAEIGALRTQLGQVNATIENQRRQIDRMLPSWESFERMKVDGFH